MQTHGDDRVSYETLLKLINDLSCVQPNYAISKIRAYGNFWVNVKMKTQKSRKYNKIWTGVCIELIVCLKYSPNVAIKSTRGRGIPLPYPTLQCECPVRVFKNQMASVRIMSAFTHRHILCHEIRNRYAQLAQFLNGLGDYIHEINLLRRRRHLRHRCTYKFVSDAWFTFATFKKIIFVGQNIVSIQIQIAA